MNQERLRQHRRLNQWHTVVLISAMALLLAGLGYFLLGKMAIIFSAATCLFALVYGPQVSSALVLRMYQARPIQQNQAPQVVELFRALVQRSELAVSPGLYYVPSRMLNAFAVGSGSTAAVAVTDGLLRAMNARELAGVMAHELSHLRHGDTKVMGLADVVSRTTATISRLGQVIILFSVPAIVTGTIPFGFRGLLLLLALIAAPAVSGVLQLALSRSREFDADAGAVEITGDPQGLVSALRKLERFHPQGLLQTLMLPHRRAPQPALLRTHPPTEERVSRLLELAPDQPTAPLRVPHSVRRELTATYPRIQRRPRWHVSGLWY